MNTKKIMAGVMLAFFVTSSMASDILIYKHINFGEWKGGATKVNEVVDLFVDKETPTPTEIISLKSAQIPNDGNAISSGDILPTSQTVDPGEILSLSLSLGQNGNTDDVKTTWNANGGSFSSTSSTGYSPSAVWVAPSVNGTFTITATIQEVNAGTIIKTASYTVSGSSPSIPTFTLSNNLVSPGNTLTAVGNEDSIDPDSGTLSYKFILKNSAGSLISESTDSSWVIDPSGLSLSGGSYSVYYQVTDGDFKTTALPKNFTFGSSSTEDDWKNWFNNIFGTNFSSWSEVNITDLDFSDKNLADMPGSMMPDLVGGYDSSVNLTLPNNATFLKRMVANQDNLNTLDFSELTEDFSDVNFGSLRLNNLKIEGNSSISENEIMRLVNEITYNSGSSFYFKDSNQGENTLVALGNKSGLTEIKNLELMGGDLNNLEGKIVRERLVVYDKSVTSSIPSDLPNIFNLKGSANSGLFVDFSTTGKLNGLNLSKFEFLEPRNLDIRNSTVIPISAGGNSALCNSIDSGDTIMNVTGSGLYFSDKGDVCGTDSSQEWMDWWNSTFGTSFTDWSEFNPGTTDFSAVSVADLPESPLRDIDSSFHDSVEFKGMSNVEMVNKLLSNQDITGVVNLKSVVSGSSPLMDFSNIQAKGLVMPEVDTGISGADQDALLGQISLTGVQSLDVGGSQVSDAGLSNLFGRYLSFSALETDFSNHTADGLASADLINYLQLRGDAVVTDKDVAKNVNIGTLEILSSSFNMGNVEMWTPNVLRVANGTTITSKAAYDSAMCESIWNGSTVLQPGWIDDVDTLCAETPADIQWVRFFNNQCGHGFSDWADVLAASEINCSNKNLINSDIPSVVMPNLDNNTSLDLSNNSALTNLNFLSGLRNVQDLKLTGILANSILPLSGITSANTIQYTFSGVANKVEGDTTLCTLIGAGSITIYDNLVAQSAGEAKKKVCNPTGSTEQVAWMLFFNNQCNESYLNWSDVSADESVNCSNSSISNSDFPAESLPVLGANSGIDFSGNSGLSNAFSYISNNNSQLKNLSVYGTANGDYSQIENMSQIESLEVNINEVSALAEGTLPFCSSIDSGTTKVYDFSSGSSILLTAGQALSNLCTATGVENPIVDGVVYDVEKGENSDWRGRGDHVITIGNGVEIVINNENEKIKVIYPNGDVDSYWLYSGGQRAFVFDEGTKSWFAVNVTENSSGGVISKYSYDIELVKQPVVSRASIQSDWVKINNADEAYRIYDNSDPIYKINIDDGASLSYVCGGKIVYKDSDGVESSKNVNEGCGNYMNASFDFNYEGSFIFAEDQNNPAYFWMRDYTPQAASLESSGDMGGDDNLNSRYYLNFKKNFSDGSSINYDGLNRGSITWFKYKNPFGVVKTFSRDYGLYQGEGWYWVPTDAAGSNYDTMIRTGQSLINSGVTVEYESKPVSDFYNSVGFSDINKKVSFGLYSDGNAVMDIRRGLVFPMFFDDEGTYAEYNLDSQRLRLFCNNSLVSNSYRDYRSNSNGGTAKQGECNGKWYSVYPYSNSSIDFQISVVTPPPLEEGEYDMNLWGGDVWSKAVFDNGDSVVWDPVNYRISYYDGENRYREASNQILINHSNGKTYGIVATGTAPNVRLSIKEGGFAPSYCEDTDVHFGNVGVNTTMYISDKVFLSGRDKISRVTETPSTNRLKSCGGSSATGRVSCRAQKDSSNGKRPVTVELSNGETCQMSFSWD